MRAVINKRPRIPVKSRRRQIFVPCTGGIDLKTQELRKNPGTAQIALNFEPDIEDGFRLIDGYERIDGRAAPSLGTWYVVELTDASDRAVGETLTGAGGASSVIILIDGNKVAITAFNGTSYVADETTNGTGDVVDEELEQGSLTNYTDIQIELAAQNYYRDLIAALPGSGDVLGIHIHQGTIYGFRNNAGGTASVLHKATTGGWTEVALYHRVEFSGGSNDFVYGEAVTTSGAATGVVKKVVKLSGEWASLNAAGFLMVQVTAGTFTATHTMTGAGGGAATIAATATATTLLPDGRYEFISHNFYAQNATYYVYGCDSVNKAFEIDTNDVYTPLVTASSPDTPKYLAAHRNRLFLAIGASLIVSEAGVPYGYEGSRGATEIAIGAPVTGMKTQPGETMSVATVRNTWGIYGTGDDTDPFTPQLISESAGAFDYSYVSLGYPFGMNDQGVVAQQRVNAYGNFEAATISRLIQPLIDSKKLLLTASSVLRKRNQIRFYFSDATVIVIAFNMTSEGLSARATTLLLDHVVTCICNGVGASGEERILFGSQNGMVYEAEKGFTFDGEAREWYLKMSHFNPFKNIKQEFQLHGITPQIRSTADFTMQATYELSYGSEINAPAAARTKAVGGPGAYYDEDNYDASYYDLAYVQQSGLPFKGKGNSVSLSMFGDDQYTKSFTVEGLTFDVSPMGVIRAY